MSRAARSRWLRERAADRVAAGLPKQTPPRRSHYQTADIREVVHSELQGMRTQIEQHLDRAVHQQWAFDARRAAREQAEFNKERREDIAV